VTLHLTASSNLTMYTGAAFRHPAAGPYSPPYSTSSSIQTTFRYVKVTLHLTASNLTLHSVPPPGSGAVLAAILNIIQHSDNFQVCKGS
jgi:hypothetical protein